MKKALFIVCGILILMIAVHAASSSKKNTPDLVISKVKVDNSNKKYVKLSYTVTNKGNVTADASKTLIDLSPVSGNGLDQTIVNDTPSLPPSQSISVQINYPMATQGKYMINATADYNNKIAESSELNNMNSISFSIGRKIFGK